MCSAAAYSQAGKHALAVDDCQTALTVDPQFSKAYSRLGLALYALGRYQEAVDAYQKGLELDPNNEIMKQSLEKAKSQLSTDISAQERSAGPTAGGNGAGAAAGMDFASLLNNPALMQMAGQAMQNPQMASMLQGLMGGGGQGGAGGLSDLLSNPQLQNMCVLHLYFYIMILVL
jgi:small glutamine-rich tetratricopeptide repeat-containing protein alpha